MCFLSVSVPPHGFRSSGQNETSITLLWNPVNSSVSFVLQFNGTESNISVPTGSGPATYTVSSLTPATKYTFTLFSVFENVTSSGISIDAVTAPQNVEIFKLIGLNDTSMTLQWSKVRGTGYILQYNQQWKTIPASDEDGPVTYTVSSLSPATEYMCTLYSVFENARSTGVPLRVFTDHQHLPCGQGFCPSDHVCINGNGTFQCLDGCQHYTVLNDDWLSDYNVNGNSLCYGSYQPSDWYRMFVGQSSAQIPETCVQESRCSSYRIWSRTPHPVRYNETVTLSINIARDSDCYYNYYYNSYNNYYYNNYYYYNSNLMTRRCYGDFYVYKLPILPGCDLSYCAVPPHGFRSSGQNDTSITLLWNPVNSSVSFVLQFNGTESNISVPTGSGPATYTISSLTPATKYTFTLFSVFENVTSSGISIDAVTAPQNVEIFKLIGLNDTSMTLQWSKVGGTGYILQYNQQWKTIPASDEDGPVTYTVSSLSPATVYMCTLYSVFENARSTGVPLRVFTGKKFLDIPCYNTKTKILSDSFQS
ncbi:receptor-type tyrosine-protein phosphatase H-like [Oryzias latipes]